MDQAGPTGQEGEPPELRRRRRSRSFTMATGFYRAPGAKWVLARPRAGSKRVPGTFCRLFIVGEERWRSEAATGKLPVKASAQEEQPREGAVRESSGGGELTDINCNRPEWMKMPVEAPRRSSLGGGNGVLTRAKASRGRRRRNRRGGPPVSESEKRRREPVRYRPIEDGRRGSLHLNARPQTNGCSRAVGS